MSLDVGMSKAF